MMDDMTELDRQDFLEESLVALVADTPNPWWPDDEGYSDENS